MNLCPWAHRCDPHDIKHQPTTSSAMCTRCGRRWIQYTDETGRTRVRTEPETRLPEWVVFDQRNRLANVETGEIIDASSAQACETAHQRDRPCDRCPSYE
jgi:hypothetical protein